MHRAHGPVQARAAKGVAGGAVDAEQGDDITGAGPLDLFHLVGMHANQAADLEFFAGAAVNDGVALLNQALVGADVGQLPVAAILKFEGQGHQRVL